MKKSTKASHISPLLPPARRDAALSLVDDE
jgi:hypothetical protein